MLKWVLIGLGVLVAIQFLNNRNQTTSAGGIFPDGSKTSSGGVGGLVNSTTGLFNSISRLLGGSGGTTSVKDRDGLISPTW